MSEEQNQERAIIADEQDVEYEIGHLDETQGKEAEEFALKVIKAAASLKMVKIDRGKFLRTELQKHYPEADLDLAVSETPAEAGVPAEVLDTIATEAIDFETKKCSAFSFAAGIPGGLAMAGTVPADLAQYFVHVMRIEQKLAYIYGWQSFLEDNDEVDDESLAKFIMLLGVMMNVGAAANAINSFANQTAKIGVQKAIQKQALTKLPFWPVLRKILRVLGVQLTKEAFSKGVSKLIPVIGGLVSGGVTYATFKPSAEHLRKYLRELPNSGIEPGTPEIEQANPAQDAVHAITDGAAAAADVAAKAGSAVVDGAAQVGSIVAEGAAQAGSAIADGAAKAGSAAMEGAAHVGSAIAEGAGNIGKFFGSFGKR